MEVTAKLSKSCFLRTFYCLFITVSIFFQRIRENLYYKFWDRYSSVTVHKMRSHSYTKVLSVLYFGRIKFSAFEFKALWICWSQALRISDFPFRVEHSRPNQTHYEIARSLEFKSSSQLKLKLRPWSGCEYKSKNKKEGAWLISITGQHIYK